MTEDAFLMFMTLFVLFCVFVAFVKERFEPHIVSLTGMIVLLIVGAISTNDMLSVFSSSAPITIACMFILGAALDQNGVIDMLGRGLLKIVARNKYLGIFLAFLVIMITSAFMNNTPVVIILTPVMITLANKLKHYPSKYLIPLSYATMLGGTCTLIGTSTNIIVSDLAQKHGQEPFSMFEITGAGAIMAAVGLAFIATFGRFLLPDRHPPLDTSEHIAVKRFLAEAIIPLDSPLIGRSLNDIKFTDNEDYEIIDLVRKDVGARMAHAQKSQHSSSFLRRIFTIHKSAAISDAQSISSFRDIKLEAGDRLLFKLSKDEIVQLQKNIGVEFDRQKAHFSEALPTREVKVAEGFIPPTSNFIGRRIKDLRLRRAYGCFVIGVHRKDKNITGDIPHIIVKDGDTLVLEGGEDDLERLFDNEQILNASTMRSMALNKQKALIAVAALLCVIVLSAFGVMPIAGLSMIGALAVILGGCLTGEQAYKTIDWRILLLIFGMLGIGIAMENTGAGQMIINHVVSLMGDNVTPMMLLIVIYLSASLLTEAITNNAVAILLTPIAISMALTFGYDPRPFIVAIMFAASVSFATPISYQTNTFVYAAGGYKFIDFLKIGIPMNILMFITAMIIIPKFWPY